MAAIATLPVLFATGIHSARPAASAVGSGGLYSCTTHSLVYQTDGSSWTTWATLGTAGAIVDPMTTRGDIIYRDAANVTTRLAAGSTPGDVLTTDGTDISWDTPTGGTPDLDAVIAVSGGQDISDALSGAAAPDAGNVFATMADVGGGGSTSAPGGGRLTLPGSGFAADVFALGPVAYWRLNEVGGYQFYDYSGNFYDCQQDIANGRSSPAAALLVGGDGDARSTDLQSTSIKARGSGLSVNDVFSVVALIRPSAIGGDQAIISGDGTGTLSFRTSGTTLQLLSQQTAVIVTSTGVTFVNGTTYIVGCTKNGSTVKLYVNGTDVTGSVSNQTLSNGAYVDIGNSNGERFKGRMAELALFNFALTGTNMTNLKTASGL